MIQKALDRMADLDKVKLLLLDVDGVLTDGRVIYDDKANQIKEFDARDGLGIRLLMKSGVPVGIVTGRSSEALAHRCQNLGIALVFQGVGDKAKALERILQTTGAGAWETAFVGDDLTDMPILARVGLPIAVADAREEIRAMAKGITEAHGGHGAVREVCEAILKAKGLWESILSGFAG